MVVQLHLRFAAGTCVLAAGILMGGGAVAVAEPDSDGSPSPGIGGINAPGSGGIPGSVGNLTDSVQNTINDVTSTVGSGTSSTSPGRATSPVPSTVGSGRQPGQQPSTASSTVGSGQQPSTASSTVGSGRQPAQQPSSGANSPNIPQGSTGTGSSVVAAVPDLVASVPNVVASVPNVVASVPDVVASVPDVFALLAPVPDVVAPVTGVVAPVTDVVISVPDTLIASGSEVIAPVQETTTSVAGAFVPLTQPPSELSPFLLGIAGMDPSATDASAGVHGAGLFAAVDASVAPISPLLLPFTSVPGVPLPGTAGVATGSQIPLSSFIASLSRSSSLQPEAAPRAPEGFFGGVRSFLRHALHNLPLAASLAALAAIALPGIGGLVILTLAGVRVGYRQAKAGFVVRTTGTARFARAGPPVGVRPRAWNARYLANKAA